MSAALVFSLAFCFQPACYAGNNILLIIADDFGVDAHGLYGIASSAAPTPTIDSLATQGVRFDRAWSNPVCSPTRASILTGRYSFRTGVGSATTNQAIDKDEYTVADALGSMGYSTALIGKWHLGTDLFNSPDRLGFDHYAGYLSGQLPDYYNWDKVTNGVHTTVTNYATTENVDDAISWVTAQEASDPNKPWFLWLAFNAPHDPFHKPPDNLHSFDYLSGTTTDITANPLPYYQAMVEAMDTEINRLLNAIDRANTTIIFIGDNGTPKEVAVPPANTLRVKGTLFQGGVWVPLIISEPGVTLTSETNGALVNAADLFSTIIEIAGGAVSNLVPSGTAIDSVSLVPLLQNPALSSQCEYVLAEQFNQPPKNIDGKTIRNDQYKLIRYDLGGERFYRMSNDPALYPTDEANNLLSESLTTEEQANYDALSNELNSLLGGGYTDRVCSIDTDGDGVSDDQDNCPNIPNAGQENYDGDAQGDACDDDDDNDGVPDTADAFPLDPAESVDTDGDGIGNNADTDDDGDGVDDTLDAFPLDPAESVDTDGDGIGNNADTDDDGDGLTDSEEISTYGTNPLLQDTDGDSYNDGVEISAGSDPLDISSVPTLANNGDINNDGQVDLADLLLAGRILAGQYTPTQDEQSRWDLAPLAGGIPAPDGQNTAADYLILQRKVMGLINF
ncbi:MAG: sulfatase-like hydrolase/transferase [Thiogranum sp.]